MPPRAYHHVLNDFGLEVLAEKAYATHSEYVFGVALPWVPETFLARFPVSVKSL